MPTLEREGQSYSQNCGQWTKMAVFVPAPSPAPHQGLKRDKNL